MWDASKCDLCGDCLTKCLYINYDKDKDAAPRVVAKGRGEVAEKIIETARAYHVPLVEDENLVQVLEALDLETQIPPELYRAVAEVLAFVYRMNRQMQS